jgi:hypothetical protein
MVPRFEAVVVLAPNTLTFEIAPPLEINNDPLHGPFRDQYFERNVSKADVRPKKNAMEHQGMVAQKRPTRMRQLIRHGRSLVLIREAAVPFETRSRTCLVKNVRHTIEYKNAGCCKPYRDGAFFMGGARPSH